MCRAQQRVDLRAPALARVVQADGGAEPEPGFPEAWGPPRLTCVVLN